MALDRYNYVFSNPLRNNDPTGNWIVEDVEPDFETSTLAAEKEPVIYLSPVVGPSIEWIQWFGPTEFALRAGGKWGYTLCCQGNHCGIDFGAPWGTPVRAGIYGNVVGVWGPDNPAAYFGPYRVDVQMGEYRVIYGHLSGTIYVEPGDYVTPTTVIGQVGNPSGDPKKGNTNIHLEMRSPYSVSGWPEPWIYNPLRFMKDEVYQMLYALSVSQADELVKLPNDSMPLKYLTVRRGGIPR